MIFLLSACENDSGWDEHFLFIVGEESREWEKRLLPFSACERSREWEKRLCLFIACEKSREWEKRLLLYSACEKSREWEKRLFPFSACEKSREWEKRLRLFSACEKRREWEKRLLPFSACEKSRVWEKKLFPLGARRLGCTWLMSPAPLTDCLRLACYRRCVQKRYLESWCVLSAAGCGNVVQLLSYQARNQTKWRCPTVCTKGQCGVRRFGPFFTKTRQRRPANLIFMKSNMLTTLARTRSLISKLIPPLFTPTLTSALKV